MSGKLIVKLICFLVALTSPLLRAEICTLRTIEDIEVEWSEECLFLIDLDNCLFQAKQALGHANWFYDLVAERMQRGMTQQEAVMDAYPLWIKVQERCEVQPVESAFVDLIRQLQKRGVPLMGLTHRHPTVAHATVRQVDSLGLDLTQTAPLPIKQQVFCKI